MLLAACFVLCLPQSLSNDSFEPQLLAEFSTEAIYRPNESRTYALGDDLLRLSLGLHPSILPPAINDEERWKFQRLSSAGEVLWETQLTFPDSDFLTPGLGYDETDGTIAFVTTAFSAEEVRLWILDADTGALGGYTALPLDPYFGAEVADFDVEGRRLYLAGSETAATSSSKRRVAAVTLDTLEQCWTFVGFDPVIIPTTQTWLRLSPDKSACYWASMNGPDLFTTQLTVAKFDAQGGGLLWTNESGALSDWIVSLSPDGQKLGYAVDTFGELTYGQIDANTGATSWQQDYPEGGFPEAAQLTYSEDSSRIGVGFHRLDPFLASVIIEADATDGAITWTQAREFPGITSFFSGASSQVSASGASRWLWGYGMPIQGTDNFTVESLQVGTGAVLGSFTGTTTGQAPAYLGEFLGADSQGRVPLAFTYSDFDVPIPWSTRGVLLIDPAGPQPLWEATIEVMGPDRSFIQQLAEVGDGSSALVLIEGEDTAPPGVVLDDLIFGVDLSTGEELWSRPVRAASFAVSPDGNRVAVRGNDVSLYLLDAHSGEELLEIEPSPQGEIWTLPLAEGEGHQTALLGPDFVAFQESIPGGGELTVVDVVTGLPRFSESLGTAAGSPLALSGDRLYYVFEEGASRKIRWVSVATGLVGGSSAPIDGSETLVRHLLARDGHLLAGVGDEVWRFDEDLASSALVQGFTGPLALFALAPEFGVLVNSNGKATQIDIPQGNGAVADLGWELDVDPQSLLLSPADGGRVVVAPGKETTGGFIALPALEIAPRIFDAATGDLIGQSDELLGGGATFTPNAFSLAQGNRLLLGTSLIKGPTGFLNATGVTVGLVAGDLPTLYRSSDEVSLADPQPIELYLRGPQDSAGSGIHFLLAGLGQASPPTVVDGLEVPFSLSDPITACTVLQCEPSIFEGFVGAWDANGLSQARLNTPPGLGALAGQTLDLAWLGFDPLAGPGLQVVSSAVSIELVP